MMNRKQVYAHSAGIRAAMPGQRSIPTYVLSILLLGSVVGPYRAAAQNGPGTETDATRFFPRQGFMLSGYGGAGYDLLIADGGRPNDFSAVYTHMIEELLQEAPGAALARYLPGREREEPVLLREMALFMDGQPLPEKPRKGYV